MMSSRQTSCVSYLAVRKNSDTDALVDKEDTPARFYLAPAGTYDAARETALSSLRNEWASTHPRQRSPDTEWVSGLSSHLDSLVDVRVGHVRESISRNLSRFPSGHAKIDTLRRAFDSSEVDLRAGVKLCKTQCSKCQLLCTKSRSHEGPHECQTSHECIHDCDFCGEKQEDNPKGCTMRCVSGLTYIFRFLHQTALATLESTCKLLINPQGIRVDHYHIT